LTLTSAFAGANAYLIVHNADSIFYVPTTGAGSFTWNLTPGKLSGLVFGPVDFKDALGLFQATFTITELTNNAITGWSLVGLDGPNRIPQSAYRHYSGGSVSVNSVMRFDRVPCFCGNGIVDRFEQCDNGEAQNGQFGQCCTTQCTFSPA